MNNDTKPSPRTSLTRQLIVKDIRQAKTMHLSIFIFMILASNLISVASSLFIQLNGSIDRLLELAQTPHFLQMHKGDFDQEEIADFVQNHPTIKDYQIIDFINVESSLLALNGQSLENTVQDNGFVTQGVNQDLLLNLQNEPIQVAKGEVYIPIFYEHMADELIGKEMQIQNHRLLIKGFLRDSQMNSSLASSKRFLVNEGDMEWIREIGVAESLISFRMHDQKDIKDISSAYLASNLPKSGPTLTYPLFRIINAINDGLMLILLMFLSILVVAVACISIRFMILTKIEEDVREIAVMKIIGVPPSFIQTLYSKKYDFLAGFAFLLGLLLSFFFSHILARNMEKQFGRPPENIFKYIFPVFCLVFLWLLIHLFVRKILQRIRRRSAVSALRNGVESATKKKTRKPFIWKFRPLLQALAIRDIQSSFKQYSSIFLIFLLSLFMLLLPSNLVHTLASEKNTQYLGVGDYDLAMKIATDGENRQEEEDLYQDLAKERFSKSRLSLNFIFQVRHNEEVDHIFVELSDHSTFPLMYSVGGPPLANNEIALSNMQADQLELQFGDTLAIDVDGSWEEFKIAGIYSDITNGGKTAKANFPTKRTDCVWAVVELQLKDRENYQEVMVDLQKQYPDCSVYSAYEYASNMMGDVTRSMKQVSKAIIVISILLCFFITSLSIRMLILKDKRENAIRKMVGFTSKHIREIYIRKTVLLFLVAFLLSILLSSGLGKLFSLAIASSFGVSEIQFIIQPLQSFLLFPFLLLLTIVIALFIQGKSIKDQKMMDMYKE